MNNQSLVSRISAFLFISSLSVSPFFLSSCGGGGGGSSTPSVSISNASFLEGDGPSLVFTLSLSSAAGSGATVTYTTSDGTAVDGEDYTADTDTVTFTAGSTSATITIFVDDDSVYEANETFTVTLSNPVNLTLGTSTATGTITNDDSLTFDGFFTGSATVDSGGTVINNLVGLAHNNRLMLFSRTGIQNVLYDIKTINLSGSNYSATNTADVYINGALADTVTVTGSISGGQIIGTFSGGTGLADGSFDISFDVNNNRGATLARIEGSWQGNNYGIDLDTVTFSSTSIGEYAGSDDTADRCAYIGTHVIPNNTLNIYALDHDLQDIIGTCDSTYQSFDHTGFASVITDSTTDTLMYGFTNGSIALFAVLTP